MSNERRELTEEENGTGFSRGRTDKVTQRHWTVKDSPGTYAFLHKCDLHIDHEYQRKRLSNVRIRDICREWSWVGCGTLCVSERPDGTYWVLDGQHRLLAARERADIQQLPCLVFEIDSTNREAKGFLDANTRRGPVRAFDRFNALVMAGDEVAIAVKAMVDDSPYTISDTNTQNTVHCVSALMAAAKVDKQVARNIWYVCVDIHDGAPVHNKVFRGLCYIEPRLNKLAGKGGYVRSLNVHKAIARLKAVGVPAIIAEINKAAGYHGKGGEKVYAAGVTNAMNKGRGAKLVPPLVV